MKKRFSLLLSAALCLMVLLPLCARAADSPDGIPADIPRTLLYGGSTYEYISHEQNQRAYPIGTAYIFAVKSGNTYYALGENLGPVALNLQNGTLTAARGVAEVVPEPTESHTNFTEALPAKIGDKYLTITALNGPLALSDTKSFVWHFTSQYVSNTRSLFYGSLTDRDTSVSGCITFDGSAFGSTQWGAVHEENLYIYQKVCPHTQREDFPAVAATCTAGGTKAHSFCPDCGSWMNAEGERLYFQDSSPYLYRKNSFDTNATGHHYVDGVCTCDSRHTALAYELVKPGTNLFESGYRYIIAAPAGGNNWKVMDFDPEDAPDYSTGCTGVTGSDGKLYIDNRNDGRRSAAEFRITACTDQNDVLLRVPVGAQYEDYPWGLWAPDNGSEICRVATDSGYALMDIGWYPGMGGVVTPHPLSILVNADGFVEVRTLTYTQLLNPIVYGTAALPVWNGAGTRELTCFYVPDNIDSNGNPVTSVPAPNVRLFRAKVPVPSAVHSWGAWKASAYPDVEISTCPDCGRTRVRVNDILSVEARKSVVTPVLDGSGAVKTIPSLPLSTALGDTAHVILVSNAFQTLRNDLAANNARGTTFQFSGANCVTLDMNAVNALGTLLRANGADLTVTLEEIPASDRAETQRTAVEPYTARGAALYRVSFNDLAAFDGIATVCLPVPAGIADTVVYSVAEDGTLTPLPSSCDGKTVLFALRGSADCLVVPLEEGDCVLSAQAGNGTLTCTVYSPAVQRADLVIGSYGADGKMTGVKRVPLTLAKGANASTVTLDGAAGYRVFLLDSRYCPLCPVWTG